MYQKWGGGGIRRRKALISFCGKARRRETTRNIKA
jgi:hypothetical protein